jgi:hypothetical protein
MGDLITEIRACDISCNKVINNHPVTIPPYDQLSPSDQAIVDACIASHGRPVGDKAVIKLAGLLTAEQYEAYANVRNADARNIREERHLREALPFLHKLIQSEFPNSDLDKKVKQIESEVALWDDSIEPKLLAALEVMEK